MRITHGSVFSGFGGQDLSAEWIGWKNEFQCENDKYCIKVLEKNFPGVKRYGDIKTTDFTIWEGRITVLSGGFPCQPFSQSGKRKGKKDDRYLWPEMLRAIREIQPVYILGENVPGLLNSEDGVVFEQVCVDLENEGYEVLPLVIPACAVNAPHRRDRVWIVAYSNRNDASRYRHGETRGAQSQSETQQEKRQWIRNVTQRNGEEGIIANPNSGRLRGEVDWIGEPRQFNEARKNYDWQDFPTQSPICGGNDGVPYRVHRLKGLGNAFVPQVSYQIFKAIDQQLKSK